MWCWFKAPRRSDPSATPVRRPTARQPRRDGVPRPPVPLALQLGSDELGALQRETQVEEGPTGACVAPHVAVPRPPTGSPQGSRPRHDARRTAPPNHETRGAARGDPARPPAGQPQPHNARPCRCPATPGLPYRPRADEKSRSVLPACWPRPTNLPRGDHEPLGPARPRDLGQGQAIVP